MCAQILDPPPVDQSPVQPVDQSPVELVDQSSVQTSVQPSVQSPVQPSVQSPVQSVDQSPVQPVDQSSVQTSVQSPVQPVDQSSVQPSVQSVDQPSVQPPVQPQVSPFDRPQVSPVDQPVDQPPVSPFNRPRVLSFDRPQVSPFDRPPLIVPIWNHEQAQEPDNIAMSAHPTSIYALECLHKIMDDISEIKENIPNNEYLSISNNLKIIFNYINDSSDTFNNRSNYPFNGIETIYNPRPIRREFNQSSPTIITSRYIQPRNFQEVLENGLADLLDIWDDQDYIHNTENMFEITRNTNNQDYKEICQNLFRSNNVNYNFSDIIIETILLTTSNNFDRYRIHSVLLYKYINWLFFYSKFKKLWLSIYMIFSTLFSFIALILHLTILGLDMIIKGVYNYLFKFINSIFTKIAYANVRLTLKIVRKTLIENGNDLGRHNFLLLIDKFLLLIDRL
jgi:hypothetical protein